MVSNGLTDCGLKSSAPWALISNPMRRAISIARLFETAARAMCMLSISTPSFPGSSTPITSGRQCRGSGRIGILCVRVCTSWAFYGGPLYNGFGGVCYTPNGLILMTWQCRFRSMFSCNFVQCAAYISRRACRTFDWSTADKDPSGPTSG